MVANCRLNITSERLRTLKGQAKHKAILRLYLRSGVLEHFPVCASVFTPDGQPIERICKQFWERRMARGSRIQSADKGRCECVLDTNFNKWWSQKNPFGKSESDTKRQNRKHGLWETNSEAKDNWMPKMWNRLTQ